MMPLVRNRQLRSFTDQLFGCVCAMDRLRASKFHDSISPSCAVKAFNHFHFSDANKAEFSTAEQDPILKCSSEAVAIRLSCLVQFTWFAWIRLLKTLGSSLIGLLPIANTRLCQNGATEESQFPCHSCMPLFELSH